jgi:hypothetical protein
MASRLVTYPEWLAHGHYPDGSNPGAKFNPDDKNLRSYYDNYVSTWNGAAEALRVAINVQHGLGSFNSGGGEGGGGEGGGTAPSTGPVFSPLDLSAPGQNDYWDYYPQSYMPTDPAYPTMGLLSQPYGNNVDTYQPWSQQYGSSGLIPDNLWNYNPPSLPGPGVSYFNANPFSIGGSEGGGSTSPTTPTTPTTPDDGGNTDGNPDGPGAGLKGAAAANPATTSSGVVHGTVHSGEEVWGGETTVDDGTSAFTTALPDMPAIGFTAGYWGEDGGWVDGTGHPDPGRGLGMGGLGGDGTPGGSWT